jgi:hypothetical protein
MFIIIKTGIVPASASKLNISSLLTKLLLEVGIFNDRLLADLIDSPRKIVWSWVKCGCEQYIAWLGLRDCRPLGMPVRCEESDEGWQVSSCWSKEFASYFPDSKQEAGLISIMPFRTCLWTVRIAQRLTVTISGEHVVQNLFLALWSKLTYDLPGIFVN